MGKQQQQHSMQQSQGQQDGRRSSSSSTCSSSSNNSNCMASSQCKRTILVHHVLDFTCQSMILHCYLGLVCRRSAFEAFLALLTLNPSSVAISSTSYLFEGPCMYLVPFLWSFRKLPETLQQLLLLQFMRKGIERPCMCLAPFLWPLSCRTSSLAPLPVPPLLSF